MAVLIKGKSIQCNQASRDHYLRGAENEHITVHDVSGFATRDAEEALSMIELSAKGTRCKKPLYSVKLNPETDRLWTKVELKQAVGMLEKNLGLTGHARVVVEHQKQGRTHYHVLWSRFPPDGGKAKNMGNDYAIHQKTQKEIEKAFKLRPMMAKGRDFKQWEVEWSKRYGYDVFVLQEQITRDFNNLKSGQAFLAALKAKGIVLCRGDKSQFVLILPWGQHKALSSMIYGRPPKAVLRRALGDIDIRKLPTVAEGKAQVKATLPTPLSKRKATAKRRSGGGKQVHVRKGSSPPLRQKYHVFHVPLLRIGKPMQPLSGSPQTRKTATNNLLSKSISPITQTTHSGGTHPVLDSKTLFSIQRNAPLQTGTGPDNRNPQPLTSSIPTPTLKGRSPTIQIPPTFKTGKEQVEKEQIFIPHRPVAHGGMSQAQRTDLKAAQEGKITWAEYYGKWGRGLTL
jgi:hypothetical protein